MIPKNSLTELAAVPGSLILTAGIPLIFLYHGLEEMI